MKEKQLPAVEACNVTVRLDGAAVLSHLDFSASTGESVSIVGRSGEGKTTLLHTLAGLLTPEEGNVYVNGRNLSGLPTGEHDALRLSEIGYVFQFSELVPELTLIENVMLPRYVRGEPRKKVQRDALDLLAGVGIDPDTAHRRPALVSGGQAQRAAIARALSIKPTILLADEPTGALDPATSESVLTTLLEQTGNMETCLIIVTHDEEVSRTTHRRLELREGRLHEKVT
ncbi:ABC transporter ATP-binding protein [Corynebacterium sp. 21KM1197]|uniref:ABC transporter ATP-binding protein n=1 Tax=Corynebacterium sp. 21KM1197 TaxID=2989734 RepID=UPI0029C9F15E|nr:ATP-binding cassette domain-containing protein [Corynebacterium sp. 21KM1197]WPF69338.1 ATP-binding cassette domain-containing protein [Corynebacterium sp. 21KM1197]